MSFTKSVARRVVPGGAHVRTRGRRHTTPNRRAKMSVLSSGGTATTVLMVLAVLARAPLRDAPNCKAIHWMTARAARHGTLQHPNFIAPLPLRRGHITRTYIRGT